MAARIYMSYIEPSAPHHPSLAAPSQHHRCCRNSRGLLGACSARIQPIQGRALGRTRHPMAEPASQPPDRLHPPPWRGIVEVEPG